ncbi:unnamed protein product [Pseudo-nitzschia multistriata]|uniref:PPPDE domain-containing protein n=1 Tax=Pseudo-nitzschia multistriata TaxID=183589 RepID=A0A448ZCP1_9STRA|nr:unnamed protein product [Pseudo-nitzschia multistriata]
MEPASELQSSSSSSFLPKSRAEETFANAEADAIERWLTSPAKTTTTSTGTPSHATRLPKTTITDIAIRRRRQLQDEKYQQQQSLPTSPQHEEQQDDKAGNATSVSPRSSLRRSKLLRKQRERQRQSLQRNLPAATVEKTGKNKPPAYCHQTAVMAMRAMDNVSHKHYQSHSHFAAKDPVTDDTCDGKETKNSTNIARVEDNAFSFEDTHDVTTATSLESNDEYLQDDNFRKESYSRSFCDSSNVNSNPKVSNFLPNTTAKKISPTKTTLSVATTEASDQKKHPTVQHSTSGVIIASPGIEAIRRRRQQRLQQQAELEREMRELEREEQGLIMAIRRAEGASTAAVPHDEVDKNHRKGSATPYSFPEAKQSFDTTPALSPLARLRQTHNIDSNSTTGGKRIVSVSPTKKIHLLKRHDASGGDSPLSKTARPLVGQDVTLVDDPSSTELDSTVGRDTLRRQEENAASSEQLQLLRQQSSKRITKYKSEGDHEQHLEQQQRSFATANGSYLPNPPLRKLHPSRDIENEHSPKINEQLIREGQRQPEGEDANSQPDPHRRPRTYNSHHLDHLSQNDKTQIEVSNKSVNTDSFDSKANKNNTMRIKAAVARSRLSRNGSKSNLCDDASGYNLISDDPVLKQHFQSASLSCSSVITTATSTVSIASTGGSSKSNNSQYTFESNDGESSIDSSMTEDDTTAMTSITEQDEEKRLQAMKAVANETSIAAPSPRDTETSFGSQAETEPIGNLSHRPPRLAKHHPQHQFSVPTHSGSTNHLNTAPVTMSADNSGSVLTRSEKIIPPIDKNSMVVRLEGKNRNQESSVARYGRSGESAMALIVQSTTGTATGGSSAITRRTSERELAKSNWIKLHVYDLVADDTQLDVYGCHFPLGQVFNAFNSSLHSIGTGAYHVGVEIDGVEYAFGANNTKDLTGVFTCTPKNSPGYQYRTTIDFGHRLVTKRYGKREEAVDGRDVIRGMAREYLGLDYDLLRKNCCTFARDACIRLCIKEEEIPSWFHNLAEAGAATQDAANFTLAPIAQLFSGDQVERFTDYLNETPLDKKAIRDAPTEERRMEEPIEHGAYQF